MKPLVIETRYVLKLGLINNAQGRAALKNDDYVLLCSDSAPLDPALDLVQLVKAITVGEVDALARLYALTVRQVTALARFKVGSREDAEEIVYDVYIYVWQNARAYDVKRGSVRAWLSIMTRNRAIDRLRQRRTTVSLDDKKFEPLALSLESVTPGPEQSLSCVQSSAAIHRALQFLSVERRNLIRLSFLEGHTHEEIAASVGIPLGTVKSHVRRALASMQRHLVADAAATGVHQPRISNPGLRSVSRTRVTPSFAPKH